MNTQQTKAARSRSTCRHTGKWPVECEDEGCGFTATKRGNLEMHMQTHTGELPFVCEAKGCDYAVMRSEHLKMHVRWVHTE